MELDGYVIARGLVWFEAVKAGGEVVEAKEESISAI